MSTDHSLITFESAFRFQLRAAYQDYLKLIRNLNRVVIIRTGCVIIHQVSASLKPEEEYKLGSPYAVLSIDRWGVKNRPCQSHHLPLRHGTSHFPLNEEFVTQRNTLGFQENPGNSRSHRTVQHCFFFLKVANLVWPLCCWMEDLRVNNSARTSCTIVRGGWGGATTLAAPKYKAWKR